MAFLFPSSSGSSGLASHRVQERAPWRPLLCRNSLVRGTIFGPLLCLLCCLPGLLLLRFTSDLKARELHQRPGRFGTGGFLAHSR